MIHHRVRLVLALLAVLAVALVPASELRAQAGKGTIKIAGAMYDLETATLNFFA